MFGSPGKSRLLLLSLAGLLFFSVTTGTIRADGCRKPLQKENRTGNQGWDSAGCVSDVAIPPLAIVCDQLVVNPDFDAAENDYFGWEQNLIFTSSFTDRDDITRDGAWFGGMDQADHYLYQDITLPGADTTAVLSYYWALNPSAPADAPLESSEAMTMSVRSGDNTILQTVQVIGNDSERRLWVQESFDLNGYIGQDIRLYADATTRSTTTSWYLDQVTIQSCRPVDMPHQLYQPLILQIS